MFCIFASRFRLVVSRASYFGSFSLWISLASLFLLVMHLYCQRDASHAFQSSFYSRIKLIFLIQALVSLSGVWWHVPVLYLTSSFCSMCQDRLKFGRIFPPCRWELLGASVAENTGATFVTEAWRQTQFRNSEYTNFSQLSRCSFPAHG